MTNLTLEDRVTAIETQLAHVVEAVTSPASVTAMKETGATLVQTVENLHTAMELISNDYKSMHDQTVTANTAVPAAAEGTAS